MEETNECNKITEQVVCYFPKRMFRESSLVIASNEAEQVVPRGLWIKWKHYNPDRDISILSTIYEDKPKILPKLDNTKLETLRLAAT